MNFMIDRLAPVAVFAYDRPWHLQQTIESLVKNDLADQTAVTVFSDGPKSPDDQAAVEQVRAYLKTVNGFREFSVVERSRNFGLATSIVEGVSDLVDRHGRVIVLEDDMAAAPSFLAYMNQALERYSADDRVWHVSAWTCALDRTGLPDVWFWRLMNCSGGWGTWSDRWCHYERDPEKLIRSWSREWIRRFNLDGSADFWDQVASNVAGRLRTWAIFWYATIFDNHGLCLNPRHPYVRNIGYDGSGQHCGPVGGEDVPLAQSAQVAWPSVVAEHPAALAAARRYYRTHRVSRTRKLFRRIRHALKS